MVIIEDQGNTVHFTVRGMHKLWAFRSGVTIPKEHILRAYQDKSEIDHMSGIRALGTSIPFVIHAGTFILTEGTVFCDFSNEDRTIIIPLQNEFYKKMIVEVEDPQAAIDFLNRR